MGRYRSRFRPRDERPVGRIRGQNGTWSTVRIDYQTALFAVHHDRRAVTHYTVTHGLTGLSVLTGLPLSQAKRIADALQERPELWRFCELTLPPEARSHLIQTKMNIIGQSKEPAK